jgi:aspartyl-tRNA(Asn)/glutamyl-tRNA(Gln) amidotransferase subunit B
MENGISDKYEIVIGLEVHAQLQTLSKAYAGDSTEFGLAPNSNISAITIAHPGTLPRFNERVLEYAIKMGLACHCEITEYNIFDRKNYFYPDLPKGYQITQDKTPICRGGYVEVDMPDGSQRQIALTRIHMEEDAGKSLHLAEEVDTLVDLNRAGVALIEIVTDPVLRTPEEAYWYLTEVRRLVRYLDICDGNMEEGSLRCDANISVRLRGETSYRTRVEVKNMNSFRNVERAIIVEAKRQIAAYEAGETIIGETRMFDAVSGNTYSLRTKESLNDYRYFCEPDLQPLVVSEEYLQSVAQQMPALPKMLKEKFMSEYKLSQYDANILVDIKETALYFEEICSQTQLYKSAANWIIGPVKSYLNENGLQMRDFSLPSSKIVELINLVAENKVSFAIAAQNLFPIVMQNPTASVEQKAQELDLIQNSNADEITPLIDEILAAFPAKVAEYKGGKKGILGMFMGELRRKTQNKVDPKTASELIAKRLEEI